MRVLFLDVRKAEDPHGRATATTLVQTKRGLALFWERVSVRGIHNTLVSPLSTHLEHNGESLLMFPSQTLQLAKQKILAPRLLPAVRNAY